MDVYIKAVKKASIVKKKNITVKDIADVYAPLSYKNKIENINIMTVTQEQKKSYLISSIDIIKAISKEYNDATINMVGEIDTIVQYEPQNPQNNKIWVAAKVIFIVMILFAGAATAIMSFHSDAQIPEVLENYYYIFFGEEVKRPLIIEIPYSIGLAVGIIAFYNHLFKWHITTDPTPLEVEMTAYEQEIDACQMDTLSGERKNGE